MKATAKKWFGRAKAFGLFCLWYFLGLTACVRGPFYPAQPIPCAADSDCPDGWVCAFPAIDTRPICMDNSPIAPPGPGDE